MGSSSSVPQKERAEQPGVGQRYPAPETEENKTTMEPPNGIIPSERIGNAEYTSTVSLPDDENNREKYTCKNTYKNTEEPEDKVINDEPKGGIDADDKVGIDADDKGDIDADDKGGIDTDDRPKQTEEATLDGQTSLKESDAEKRKETIISAVTNLIDKMKALEKYTDDDGDYKSEVHKAVNVINAAYFGLESTKFVEEKTKLTHVVDLRRKVIAIMMATDMVDMCCDIVVNGYSKYSNKGDGDYGFNLVLQSLLVLSNYSDESDEIAEFLTNKPGLLENLKQALEVYTKSLMAGCHYKSEEKKTFISLCLTAVHNSSMRESNIPRLRSLGYADVLQTLLMSPDEDNRLEVLAGLAAIANEEECFIINANPEVVKYLLLCLQEGMDVPLRRHEGWSCKECGLTVRLLARNDANKKLLVELGALELLVKLVRTGDNEEQYEGVNAICYLLFEDETRRHVTNTESLGLCDLLIDLKKSDDKRIKNLAANALWTLRVELSQSNVAKYREIGQRYISRADENQKSGSTSDVKGHVMISYQWADQTTLIKIRDRMKDASFKVWMDIEQMGGSTMDSMAEAIEQAHVVLVCFSHKYKDSVNCRREASYASTLNRKIIPLKMERNYKPDGWLGFLCGDEFFYDFGGKYDFDGKMNDLLKALKSCFNAVQVQKQSEVPLRRRPLSPLDVVDSVPVSAGVARRSGTVPMATIGVVRKWTKSDVDSWLQRCDLKSSKVSHLTGLEISVLMRMLHESPDCFYRCLQDILKIQDMMTLSKLVWALHDLTEQN